MVMTNLLILKGITLIHLVDDLIFKGPDQGTYKLIFANPETQKAPVYDIVNYKNMILKEGYDRLELKNIKIEQPPEEAPKKDYSLLFNITIGAVSLLLGYIILVRLKRT